MALPIFAVNGNILYAEEPYVSRNRFLTVEANPGKLPTYEEAKASLPRPLWDGHGDMLRCYDKTWQIAFRNLTNADPKAGFVSDFIDTAFNGDLFMWDSSFIVMFGKYGSRSFRFQNTLDNFYARQHKDGFICRQLCEHEAGDRFTRDDPASTGPNILPWAEWEYFSTTGDKERLSRVFDPLCGFHRWLMLNRSWPDGSYWSNGWACGMDNQLRLQPGYDVCASHGFMKWIDTSAQQYLSAQLLIKMAKVLDREEEVQWLKDEAALLESIVNGQMWSETDQFYYDSYRDGSLSGIKSIAAYWPLLADLVPQERIPGLVAHLDNEKEFKRPNRIPTLSADAAGYNADDGGYWNGAIWAPTNYMVLRGLHNHGYHRLAHEIARDFLDNVVEVFRRTGTVHENYAPETPKPGSHRGDFVGWTGLAPINMLFESVFGIHPHAQEKKLIWHVNCLERHGIENYPFGDATVNLVCEARTAETEKPVIHITSDHPVTVEIHWNGTVETVQA